MNPQIILLILQIVEQVGVPLLNQLLTQLATQQAAGGGFKAPNGQQILTALLGALSAPASTAPILPVVAPPAPVVNPAQLLQLLASLTPPTTAK